VPRPGSLNHGRAVPTPTGRPRRAVQKRPGLDISELNRRAVRKGRLTGPQDGTPDPLDGVVITEEFKEVRRLIQGGCPLVFVTGNAGTGKSTLIHYLKTTIRRGLAVVAPTGVAALNVGGVTIHSLFQFPHKIHSERDIKLCNRKLFAKLELLIIDEVSMLRCDLLDSIDASLRRNRLKDIPFGGVQLLLAGDLFQLPPVVPRHEETILKSKGYQSEYFFSACALQGNSLVPVELTSTYRQENADFVALLNRVRLAEDLESVVAELNRRCADGGTFAPDVTLTCTNAKADEINTVELERLTTEAHSFTGTVEGRWGRIEEDKLPSPLHLTVKVGARVMFTKNDEQGRRWVNGTLGIVSELGDGSIGVKLVGSRQGTVYDVRPATWERHRYYHDSETDEVQSEVVARYTQYPLMLAWAVTIHKSQGKTLDNVLVDLGYGSFAPGQVYVALSRCRSIEGIRLARPIRESDIRCDPRVKRFYLAVADMTREKHREARSIVVPIKDGAPGGE